MRTMSYQKSIKIKTHSGTLQIWREERLIDLKGLHLKKVGDEESDEDSMVMIADKDLDKNEYQKLLTE